MFGTETSTTCFSYGPVLESPFALVNCMISYFELYIVRGTLTTDWRTRVGTE